MAFVLSAAMTLLGCQLFPSFRSTEQKAGEYRADTVGNAIGSSRLPTVGGPALLVALTATLGSATVACPATGATVLPVLALCWPLGILGFGDDWAKGRGQGLSERTKLGWMVAVVACWAAWYGARALPDGTPFAVRVAWTLVAAVVLLWTILGTSFSDGVDGLTASVVTVSMLPFLAIALASHMIGGAMATAGLVGAALGFLLLNLPSRWTRRNGLPRRARAYLGDSGAFVLGSACAAVVVYERWEALWLLAGSALLYEGSSVLLQTGLLVPLFRRMLHLERYRQRLTFVPHTEFPLPFLATPYHHHLSLSGLGPLETVQTLVRIAGIGALLALVAAAAPAVAARIIVAAVALLLLIALSLWTLAGTHLHLVSREEGDVFWVELRRGFPYRLGPLPLSWPGGDVVGPLAHTGLIAVESRLSWAHRRHDAVAELARCAWAAGERAEAMHRWKALPVLAVLLRPDVAFHVAAEAQQNGSLDALLASWRQALQPYYQAGRVELVVAELQQRASAQGDEELAEALAHSSFQADAEVARDAGG